MLEKWESYLSNGTFLLFRSVADTHLSLKIGERGGGAHATAMGTAVPWAPEEEGKPLKTHFPLHKQEDFLLMHEPTGIQFNISRHTVPLRVNANGRHLHV